ncbi:MAG: EpsG family protein [Treponema sp.]|nr:EpsG family protein [Treponema sp.]
MTVYIFILVISSSLSFMYSLAKDKSARIVLVTLCFLSLFIPAAIRGGIGADYFSYLRIYYRISQGIEISQEPGIFLISKLLLLFNLPGHALIVTYSFISILFVFLAVPKKYFYLGIPVYVMVFYLDSYCLLRQALACSVMLFAYRKYFEGSTKSCVFWSAIAFLNHKVMIIPIMLLLFSRFIQEIQPLARNAMYLLLFVVLYLLKNTIVSFVMNSVLSFTPYAGYALNRYATAEAGRNSGLGFLLQILLLIILLYLSDSDVLSKREYKVCGIYFVYLLFVRCLSQVLFIFVRLVNSVTFIYVPFIISASKSRSRERRLLIAFFYFAIALLYVKGILNAPIHGQDMVGGKQVYPYTTIFNYKDNSLIMQRKYRFGF